MSTAYAYTVRPDPTLPEELQKAQAAINLPEVQDMLKKLSTYNLGVYMLHMHDEETGEFKVLEKGLTQVEDGLTVSFVSELEAAPNRSYVPVGWSWRDGPNPSAFCTASCVKQGAMHTTGPHS